MNAAVGVALLAIALQGADAPSLSSMTTNATVTNVAAVVKEFLPSEVYAGAAATGDYLNYLGGVSWQRGRRWGVGAEYRRWSGAVRFAGLWHDATVHVAGPYVYRSMRIHDVIALRTDAGAGLLRADAEGLRVADSWVGTIRLAGAVVLSDRMDLALWCGSVCVRGAAVSSGVARGRTRSVVWPETAMALRVRF